MSVISDIHKDLEEGAIRLIAEHRDCLFAEAVRMCKDASTAEDLVSRTFAKAIQKIDSHDESRSLAAWLKTIMQNLYRNDMKRPVVRGTDPIDPAELERMDLTDWSSDEQLLKNSDSEALREAIGRLDPKFKQVLVMHYFSELPVKAIASALNMPVGTVLWRLNIARKILAKDLAEKLGKKPLALLAVLFLGVATLFGAWTAGLGEWVEEAFSAPTAETAPITPPAATTPAAAPASALAASKPISQPISTQQTQQEEPQMNTINPVKSLKKTVLAATMLATTALGAAGNEPNANVPVMRAELSLASLSEAARLKPIAVKLATNSPVGFNYADCSPDHMAFIGANGAELPFEVATWNTSGESVIWVRPLTTDETITFFYGSSVSSGAKATDVWAEYSGVWHFDQFDPDTITRSQASSPNSTTAIGIDAHIANTTGTKINQEGFFGTGVQTADTGSDAGLWMKDAGANSPLDGGAQFTISGWFKHKAENYSWDHIFYKRSKSNNSGGDYTGAFAIENSTSDANFKVDPRGSGAKSSPKAPSVNPKGTWVQLTFVYDNTTCYFYENGTLVDDIAIDACVDNDAPLAVGNNSNYEKNGGIDSPWKGWVDEVRFSKGVKSADWIAAEYAAMTTELVWGEVEQEENNIVVVSSSAGTRYAEDQVLPQYGAYENLSGEVEFSCPAYLMLDEGRTRAICSGWTLYGSNGEVLQSGTTHQVKVALPQISYCRFVWNWNAYADTDFEVFKTVDDYVKEGLLAVWDCRDSEHLDSTGWTDTSGQYKFVFEGKNKDSITFGNAGVYFPDNAAAYLDQSGAAATFDAAADGTLEIVFVQTAKNSWGDMILQNNNSYPLGMIVYGSDLQTHVGSRAGRGWNFDVNLDAVRMVSIDYTGANDQATNALIDGKARSDSTSKTSWSHKGFTGTMLGGYRNSTTEGDYIDGWSFIGKILSVRLYSSKLTAAQKTANYQVDKTRFKDTGVVAGPTEHGFIAVDSARDGDNFSVRVAAVPEEGCRFIGWTGDLSGTQNPVSMTYPTSQSKTIGALFEPITWPVTFETPTDVELSITVDDEAIESGAVIDFGKDVVAAVTPTGDYTFDPIPSGWTQVGDTTTITRTYPVGYDPVVIDVPAKHVFTLSQVGEGMVTGGESGLYDHNTKLTLTAAPAVGYHFAGWTGAVESNELTIEVTLDEAKTLTATFEQNASDQQIVTFVGGANAAISVTVDGEPIASGAAVSKGKTVVVTATPKAHYAYAEVPDWTKNPETGAISQEVTVGTEDINIVIPDAQPIMVTLTVKQPEFGEIKSSASGSLQEGTVVTLNLTVPTGYEFLGWTDDASGTTVPLVVTVDSDMTIGANIVRIRHKATFTAPDNTTVVATVDGEEIKSEDLVEYGKSVVVTITPVGEYEYLTVPQNWSAGAVKGTITRDFKFLDQDQTFDLPAVTAIPRFEVVINACEHGSISGTAGSYLRDEVATLTPVPDEGYVFAYWTGVDNKLQLVHPLALTGYSDWRIITVGAVFRKATSIDMAYEQDGLLTMWDCRDRGHIDATGWTDVSGRFKFVFEGENKENITYDKKGVYFPDNAAAYLDQSGAAATFDAAADGTLEIVFVQTEKNSLGNMILQNNNSYPLGMIVDDSERLQTRVGTLTPIRGWSFGVNLDAVRMVSIDYTGAADQETNALIDGKERSADSRINDYWGHRGFTGTVLGAYRDSSSAATYREGRSFIGKILAVRLYSKKLTPEQKLKNYQSDVNRFVKQSGMLIIFY